MLYIFYSFFCYRKLGFLLINIMKTKYRIHVLFLVHYFMGYPVGILNCLKIYFQVKFLMFIFLMLQLLL